VQKSTFVLRATARSRGATGYPPGEKHIALIFVHASTDAADQAAINHLESTGWSEVELEERGVLDPEALNNDPDLIAVYERCIELGSAGMIYEDALNE